MDQETLRIALIAVLAGGAALSFVLAFIFRISGRFVRESEPHPLVLSAIGPFMSGRQEAGGGHHEYSGFTLLGTAWLTRRDHGVQLLLEQGYPEDIARRRDGEIAAKLVVKRRSRDALDVAFSPLRVDFTHRPPKVTGVTRLAAETRHYNRAPD